MSNGKKILGCKTSTTISSVLGNVTGIVTEYVKDKFPPDFFKSQYIATSLTSNKMQWSTWGKPKFPALSVEPEMQLNQSISNPWADYFSAYLYFYKNTKENYLPIFMNDDDEIYLTTIPQRLKFQFNFKIRTRGKMQALDLVNFISRNFEPEGYFYVNNVRLQTEIPKLYAKIIAMQKGYSLDPNDKEDHIEFINYLKQFSNGYIERNTDLADGNERFEFTYVANMLYKLAGIPTISYSNKSKDEGMSDVEFSFEVELWVPSDFLIELGNSKKEYSKLEEYSSPEFLSNTENSAFYNYTLQPNLIKTMRNDKSLILSEKFMTEDTDTIDVLDLSSFITCGIQDIIEFITLNNLEPTEFFEVALFYGSKEIPPDSFEFDFNTLELTSYAPFNSSIYHVLVYGDLAKLNSLGKFRAEKEATKKSLEEKILKH